jgi:hypothetical protein
MSEALSPAWLLCLPVATLALSLAYPGPSTHAQPAAADPQPQLVYQSPQEGAVLNQPPFAIQLCFASPINIKDLDKGGDFAFAVTEPDGIGLGSRDVFQSDGYGITVYAANPIGDPAGHWLFHYRVTSPDAKAALEGDINYSVDPDGSSAPQETPPPCTASGGPASTSSENGSDILKYGLFAAGAAGIAALFVLVLFVVRRRRGQSTHRPPTGATPRIDWPASDPRATPGPVAESGTPFPKSSPPSSFAPPAPVAESVTPLPKSSPPSSFAPPAPVAESVTPLPEWSRPKSPVPPPVVESVTPLPEPSLPPGPATPPGDTVAGESAGDRPDNSRYAPLAIAAAVIILIVLIFRRLGGSDRRRGKPGGGDGKRR